MQRKHVDATLQGYAELSVKVFLNIILVVSLLGQVGVQTASFAAVLAAMGFALGTAWSGLLAHFAAGVFIILLKPFRVGDFVTAGGITGTITEIGPFATKINTPDNVLTIVNNNKILSDTVQNFTTNPYRRVDLVMQVSIEEDMEQIIKDLVLRLSMIANVCATPVPSVEILEYSLQGTKLAVRPYCHNTDYWQVYFDTNRTMRELGIEYSLRVPEQRMVMRSAPV